MTSTPASSSTASNSGGGALVPPAAEFAAQVLVDVDDRVARPVDGCPPGDQGRDGIEFREFHAHNAIALIPVSSQNAIRSSYRCAP